MSEKSVSPKDFESLKDRFNGNFILNSFRQFNKTNCGRKRPQFVFLEKLFVKRRLVRFATSAVFAVA